MPLTSILPGTLGYKAQTCLMRPINSGSWQRHTGPISSSRFYSTPIGPISAGFPSESWIQFKVCAFHTVERPGPPQHLHCKWMGIAFLLAYKLQKEARTPRSFLKKTHPPFLLQTNHWIPTVYLYPVQKPLFA